MRAERQGSEARSSSRRSSAFSSQPLSAGSPTLHVIFRFRTSIHTGSSSPLCYYFVTAELLEGGAREGERRSVSCFVRETFYGGETHSHEGTHFCVFLRWPVFRGVDLKPLQAPFQFTTAGRVCVRPITRSRTPGLQPHDWSKEIRILQK